MFNVITEYSIAKDSLDTIHPFGTINDNTICPEFVDKIHNYFNGPVLFMDLGCAGGGLVKEFIDNGHLAIGLEGCPSNKHHQRHEWKNIPNNLFTCDITKEYTVEYDNIKATFDVITAWEVMEHIKIEDIQQLCTNIVNHLDYNGFFAMSISTAKDPYHVTLMDKDWWIETFKNNGLYYNEYITDYINPDWPRCNNQKPNTGSCPSANSFHLCVTNHV